MNSSQEVLGFASAASQAARYLSGVHEDLNAVSFLLYLPSQETETV